jgi:pimeloyl-ACP methyl ester carboxylesterase
MNACSTFICSALSALLCASITSIASAGAGSHIVLRETGSFYVKGETVRLQDETALPPQEAKQASDAGVGNRIEEFETRQVYVQFAKLAEPRHRFPMLLWHGGSLSGVTFESTPDGRPGWQTVFLRAGFSVYVVDAFQGGRAPWARFPQINPEEPLFRTKAFLWETFRIGPSGSYARRETFAGSRFPATAFEQLAMQAVPRFGISPAAGVASFIAVLEKIGPCVVLAHSASGPLAFEAARLRPELVKAVIAVEPSGGIATDDASIDALRRIPHLIIWGDNVSNGASGESWLRLYRSAKQYADTVRNAGGNLTWIDLPQEGIRGNSHMLMMDTNSDDIGARIVRWLRDRKLN